MICTLPETPRQAFFVLLDEEALVGEWGIYTAFRLSRMVSVRSASPAAAVLVRQLHP
jgi:hypothetical protein